MTPPRKVTPGQPLTASQKAGLELVARLHGGRDVVLAIDLTESVGLNDEGRNRLRQIVQDSLHPGDSVYVVPFATNVNPLPPAIEFNGKREDIDRILQVVPLDRDPNLRNTDIQRAELIIYQNLAQVNHDRLQENQPIKPQSVVWITDAPLFSKSGQEWIETPADSPFRVESSEESQQRREWIQALPMRDRKLAIRTNDNKEYNLTVVDIDPTVQELCTPAPGGRETCLVTPYLIKQLWLPASISVIVFIALVVAGIKYYRLQKKWQLIVDFTATAKEEDQICYLGHKKRIAIGEYDSTCDDSIDTPGPEVRAYLERKGDKLYLVPTGDAPIYYNGREITVQTLITGYRIRLNCPDSRKRDYEIVIKLIK
ncbi:VWA domain-containing protein [Argonema galeatum]|uniref:VWA domain-containing protein n=1 Tax=Argonema galeatum TaxID=2942762 RepID=UPI0020127391|nr:VWA domain-containing protein [Argonema galeatum A003/A1]